MYALGMKMALILLLMSSFALANTENAAFFAAGVKLPKKRFNEIIRLFEIEFQPLAAQNGRKFEILSDYNEDWAQAFARRWETDHIIVYGGASALIGGTEDSFALLLCHETGHLYGGRPWGDDKNQLALEGQADFWSPECFKRIVSKLEPRSGDRLTEAALVLTAFYADNRTIAHPRVDTHDESVVNETLKTHPEPQCRLDTILAGASGKSRPLCWFKP